MTGERQASGRPWSQAAASQTWVPLSSPILTHPGLAGTRGLLWCLFLRDTQVFGDSLCLPCGCLGGCTGSLWSSVCLVSLLTYSLSQWLPRLTLGVGLVPNHLCSPTFTRVSCMVRFATPPVIRLSLWHVCRYQWFVFMGNWSKIWKGTRTQSKGRVNCWLIPTSHAFSLKCCMWRHPGNNYERPTTCETLWNRPSAHRVHSLKCA